MRATPGAPRSGSAARRVGHGGSQAGPHRELSAGRAAAEAAGAAQRRRRTRPEQRATAGSASSRRADRQATSRRNRTTSASASAQKRSARRVASAGRFRNCGLSPNQSAPVSSMTKSRATASASRRMASRTKRRGNGSPAARWARRASETSLAMIRLSASISRPVSPMPGLQNSADILARVFEVGMECGRKSGKALISLEVTLEFMHAVEPLSFQHAIGQVRRRSRIPTVFGREPSPHLFRSRPGQGSAGPYRRPWRGHSGSNRNCSDSVCRDRVFRPPRWRVTGSHG